MHWTAPDTIVRLAPLALLLVACPGDDSPADTEATAGSSTGGVDSTGPGPGTTTTATTASSSSSTTAVVDESGTSTTGDDTTGEPPTPGLCEGYDQVGNVNSVLSRDGLPIDTTCDPMPAPCGGDLVGSWSLESTCGFEAFPNPLEAMCPGSTFMLDIVSQSGTMTFEDDGSFVQDFDIQTQAVFGLDPMACFGVDCGTFEMILQMDDPGVSCQAMGPTCTCTIPDDGMPEQATGTYAVVGTDVVFTNMDGDSTAAFCIGGDRLDLWQVLYGLPSLTDIECMTEGDCADALGDMYDAYVCGMGPG